MKKNDLIRILSEIPGNPDVLLWNGFVEDYQDIDKEPVPVDLFKMTLDGYKERVNLERHFRDKLPPMGDEDISHLYRKNKMGRWELHPYYPPEKGAEGYKSKRAWLLQAKAKGETTFDRLGAISY